MGQRRSRSNRHRATPDADALEVGARVKARRLALDYSFDAFVEELGMGRGYLSELERGLVVPSLTALHRLAEALETTAADLVLGPSEREQLFALTEQLPTSEVRALLQSATKATQTAPTEPPLPLPVVSAKQSRAIPLLWLKPAAGNYSEPQGSGIRAWLEAPRGQGTKKGLFVVQVDGRSMEPSIADGAYVLCRRPWAPSPGQLGIFARTDGRDPEGHARYTLKQYHPRVSTDGNLGGELRPKNPNFAALRPDASGEERPFGQFIKVL